MTHVESDVMLHLTDAAGVPWGGENALTKTSR